MDHWDMFECGLFEEYQKWTKVYSPGNINGKPVYVVNNYKRYESFMVSVPKDIYIIILELAILVQNGFIVASVHKHSSCGFRINFDVVEKNIPISSLNLQSETKELVIDLPYEPKLEIPRISSFGCSRSEDLWPDPIEKSQKLWKTEKWF